MRSKWKNCFLGVVNETLEAYSKSGSGTSLSFTSIEGVVGCTVFCCLWVNKGPLGWVAFVRKSGQNHPSAFSGVWQGLSVALDCFPSLYHPKLQSGPSQQSHLCDILCLCAVWRGKKRVPCISTPPYLAVSEVPIIWTVGCHEGEKGKFCRQFVVSQMKFKSFISSELRKFFFFWLWGCKRLKTAVSKPSSHPSWRQVEKVVSKKTAGKRQCLPCSQVQARVWRFSTPCILQGTMW